MKKTLLFALVAAFVSLTASAQDLLLPSKVSPDFAQPLNVLNTITLDFSNPAQDLTITSAKLGNPTGTFYIGRNAGTPQNPSYSEITVTVTPTINDDKTITLTIGPDVNEPGEYNILIPKDYFEFTTNKGEYISDQFHRVFTIEKAAVVIELPEVLESVFPAQGTVELSSMPKGLTQFVLNFKEAVTIDKSINGGVEMFYKDRPYAIETVKANSDGIKMGVNDHQVVINFANEHVTLGNYSIVIPDGLIKIGADKLGQTTLTYDLVAGEEVSVLPAEGAVGSLGDIELTYDNAQWVGVRDYTFFEVTFTHADGTPVEGILPEVYAADNTQTVGITLGEMYEVPGEYLINIPAGMFNIVYPDETEALSQKRVLHYTITAVPTPRVNPAANGLYDELGNFTLTFKQGLELVKFEEGTVATLSLTDAMGQTTTPIAYKVDAANTTVGGRVVELVPADDAAEAALKALVKGARYTFTVNAGALEFKIDGDKTETNPGYQFVYTIRDPNGVEAVLGTEADRVTVVSIEGIVVLRDAEPAALNTLPDGFYVVNGKKCLLRK